MINADYLTSNSNIAWPLDAGFPQLDTQAAKLLADGGVILKTDERTDTLVAGCRHFLVNKSEGRYRIKFTVVKIETSMMLDITESVDLDVTDGEYSVFRGGWSFFVIDNHEARVLADSGRFSTDENLLFPLDPSAVFVEPDKVTSISLYNHYDGDGNPTRTNRRTHKGIVGPVKVVGGTNVAVTSMAQANLVEGEDNYKQLNSFAFTSGINGMTIIAGAGLGAGTVPCPYDCEDIETTDTEGNVIPDDMGNVVIEGDDCITISVDGVIRLTGTCTACCQCKDFEETGDRLADQSGDVKKAYDRLIADSVKYNNAATSFNDSLDKVSREELIVKATVSAQRVEGDIAHNLQLKTISGSVDRAQGAISIVNASAKDVTVSVQANMSPQTLINATVTRPVEQNTGTISTINESSSLSGSFSKSFLLPYGSSATIRLYGARDAKTPSGNALLTGSVTFSWSGGFVSKSFSATARG